MYNSACIVVLAVIKVCMYVMHVCKACLMAALYKHPTALERYMYVCMYVCMTHWNIIVWIGKCFVDYSADHWVEMLQDNT